MNFEYKKETSFLDILNAVLQAAIQIVIKVIEHYLTVALEWFKKDIIPEIKEDLHKNKTLIENASNPELCAKKIAAQSAKIHLKNRYDEMVKKFPKINLKDFDNAIACLDVIMEMKE